MTEHTVDATAAQPCKQCSRLYRGRCVRCPICGYWRRIA
jgi:RNA polymerase subunit RPABC4/transcription elongation factor Spt4